MLREIANRNPISNCQTILNNCDECEEKNDCEERPDIQAKRILSKINNMEKGVNGTKEELQKIIKDLKCKLDETTKKIKKL